MNVAVQTINNLQLTINDLRIEIDDRSESVGKKIREATMQKIPYQIIVGQKETEAGTISVRRCDGSVSSS